MLGARARCARRRVLRHRRRAGRLPRLRRRGCWRRRASRRRSRSLPAPVARLVAGAGERAWRLLPLPGQPPLTRLAYWLSALETTIDITRARTELGYEPVRTIDERIAGARQVKIAIGADHGGFDLKEHVRARLERAGHEVVDVGTHSRRVRRLPGLRRGRRRGSSPPARPSAR